MKKRDPFNACLDGQPLDRSGQVRTRPHRESCATLARLGTKAYFCIFVLEKLKNILKHLIMMMFSCFPTCIRHRTPTNIQANSPFQSLCGPWPWCPCPWPYGPIWVHLIPWIGRHTSQDIIDHSEPITTSPRLCGCFCRGSLRGCRHPSQGHPHPGGMMFSMHISDLAKYKIYCNIHLFAETLQI